MPRPRTLTLGMQTREVYPVNPSRASLGNFPDQKALARRFMKAGDGKSNNGELDENVEPSEIGKPSESDEAGAFSEQLAFLREMASHGGNLIPLLDAARVDEIGIRAVREWEIDQGSRQRWVEIADKGLMLATQERDGEEAEKEYPFVGASDVNYPILTTAVTQFNARATPELIKGDKVVGVKTFSPPPRAASAGLGHNGSPPMAGSPAQADSDETQASLADAAAKEKQARGERVAHYLNFLIFYQMDDWEGETDLLLMESPVTGMGFKKVYMGPEGLRSDYVSAMRLTVSNNTRSLQRCPRITQDFDIYPYEIDQGVAAGTWQDVNLRVMGEDPEAPRLWIEQYRLEDLDGDGLPEPYTITVDVETRRTVAIQAGYGLDDIIVDPDALRVIRIERWVPFPTFRFLPDPKGRFYGVGLAKLLDAITDSVDTSINQLIDAGNAQIAGGGFIGGNVRLQGSGQAGVIYKQPGEWQTVSMNGADLRSALYEFTVPSPSPVTMQMLEMLLAAAKDISSVKDVVTGDAPSTAPVGTTLALQNQALQVFSAIYKRMYRGLRDEFRLMYQCLKRWATKREKAQYHEVTGGDFDDDFGGDGTDIQPVADPSVVTKMQKISRVQAVSQIAESPIGQAAGMLQPGPAREIATDMLNAMDVDRPERYFADVPPNPEAIAKVREIAAATALKAAQAQNMAARSTLDHAAAHEKMAGTVVRMGEAAEQTHRFHQEAARVSREGVEAAPEPEKEAP